MGALVLGAAIVLGCGSEQVAATGHVGVHPIPKTNAPRDPRTHDTRFTLSVPTRLVIAAATDGQLAVSVDLDDVARVKLDRGPDPNRVHGARVAWAGRTGLRGPCDRFDASCFDIGESRVDPAELPPGTELTATLVLFETDIAPGHLWAPESPLYRELWSGTISGRAP